MGSKISHIQTYLEEAPPSFPPFENTSKTRWPALCVDIMMIIELCFSIKWVSVQSTDDQFILSLDHILCISRVEEV